MKKERILEILEDIRQQFSSISIEVKQTEYQKGRTEMASYAEKVIIEIIEGIKKYVDD